MDKNNNFLEFDMPSASFFALFDDIALLLDDVAAMSKVAAKKTAGVLGDDLAVNAEQVSGVKANRELPVVWAVAKGSMLNKTILVPAALLISAFLPWLIIPLLVLGGLFLCFEGAEKIIETFQTKTEDKQKHHNELLQKVKQSPEELLNFEKNKIKGAIRTDFVLSAEIIIIALGSFAGATMTNQIVALSFIAFVMTVGVYGLVAVIVRLDDVGMHWQQLKGDTLAIKALQFLGSGLLSFAPKLMKSLSVIGLIAMFLVGGGMLTHNIGAVHHVSELVLNYLGTDLALPSLITSIASVLLDGLYGVVAGLIVAGLIHILPFGHKS